MEAAEFVGTTPRLLRRFIRQNESWNNVGHAGRYSFTEPEVEALKKQFDHWQKTRARRSSPTHDVVSEDDVSLAYLDSDPGVPLELLIKAQRSPQLKKQLESKRAARNSKLLKRMAECGLTNA